MYPYGETYDEYLRRVRNPGLQPIPPGSSLVEKIGTHIQTANEDLDRRRAGQPSIYSNPGEAPTQLAMAGTIRNPIAYGDPDAVREQSPMEFTQRDPVAFASGYDLSKAPEKAPAKEGAKGSAAPKKAMTNVAGLTYNGMQPKELPNVQAMNITDAPEQGLLDKMKAGWEGASMGEKMGLASMFANLMANSGTRYVPAGTAKPRSALVGEAMQAGIQGWLTGDKTQRERNMDQADIGLKGAQAQSHLADVPLKGAQTKAQLSEIPLREAQAREADATAGYKNWLYSPPGQAFELKKVAAGHTPGSKEYYQQAALAQEFDRVVKGAKEMHPGETIIGPDGMPMMTTSPEAKNLIGQWLNKNSANLFGAPQQKMTDQKPLPMTPDMAERARKAGKRTGDVIKDTRTGNLYIVP